MTSASTSTRVRLSLGPIQYHWPKEKMLDFYRMIEFSKVDIVYLGETICSKRRSFRYRDWVAAGERLQAAGKEVIFSTLALVEAHSELGYIRKLCNNGKFTIEANDMSAVQMLAGKMNFIGGSSLNIYNSRTLNKLVSLGMTRCVMPVELSKSVLAEFKKETPAEIESEVFGWGRLALAWSARCYTARAHKVSKDNCENCCIDYPDGLALSTREDESFLIINGIQTQSAKVYSLIRELGERAPGLDILRISPQSENTGHVISLFHQARSGSIEAADAADKLQQFSSMGLCDGYWAGEAGMATVAGHP